MAHHTQQNHGSKGKLTVLTLALAAALASMTTAQAQTTIITSADGAAQVTWSANNLLLDSTASITAATGVVSGSTLLGTLTNQGSISGVTNGISITTGNTAVLLENQAGALIGASINAIANDGTIGTVINSGIINGGNSGIYSSGAITAVSNTSTGTIIGANTAIMNDGGSISTLTNSGVISADNHGIYNFGSIDSLSNTSTGRIISGYYGVRNVGTIGTIDNSGTISGGYQGGVYNTGTIGTFLNSGLIAATANNSAIFNNGVISVLTNNGTGTISGFGVGVYNLGTVGTLSNNGSIVNTGSSAIGLYNIGTIGTLVNSGLISGDYAALYLDTGSSLASFTNTGTLAGNIENHSSQTLNINGGSGTIFGTLTGYGGGISAGDIGSIISETDVSFSGNQLLNDNIVINGGSGTVTNAGVLQLNNPITINGNYVQDASATLLIGVTSTATVTGSLTDTGYGRLVVNGDAVIASGSAITLKTLGYSFAQGQRYVVIAASGSGTDYNASTLVYSATGYSVSASVQTDSSNSSYSDLVLTLGSATSSSSSSSSSSASPINNATTSNAVSALSGLFQYGGTDAALLAVFNPAAALDTTASANKAGAQLSPAAVTSAATKAVDEATQAISNVLTSHIDGLRLAQHGSSGVATGESHDDIALWGQVFGGRAGQALRDNVSGYHANYRGLLIGADSALTDKVRAGALISAAKTNVASDDDNTGSSASINSYGLTAYASYTGDPWYINVLAGVTRQQYSTLRSISYTGFSGIASGNYRGSQYLTSAQAGYPLKLAAWLPGATLTPLVGVSYSTLRQNGYTETGGSGAALSVDASHSNSLKSELGARLESSYQVSAGKLLPSLQLGWRHEYKDSVTQTSASFVADSTGSTAFVTQSATPVANTAVLNLGVTLMRSKNLSLTGKYTLETGGGYLAQTGSVQVRWQY